MAYASGAALVGLDSLHAIGRNAPADACRVWVIADAQAASSTWPNFRRPEPGPPLSPAAETRIEILSSWLALVEPGDIVLGPALDVPRLRSVIPPIFPTQSAGANYPRGESLIVLAREAMAAGRRENPWLLEPLYLPSERRPRTSGMPGRRSPRAGRVTRLFPC